MNRKASTGGHLALIMIGLVALVMLSSALLRGARLDLTQNRLHTLTDGTKAELADIKEPINLYFFFSDKASEAQPQLRTYANRVRELVEEIAAKSAGKITLKAIDPAPFSEEEDRATGFGLQALPLGQGDDKVFFGLAGTNSTDGQMIIPFFDPAKEAFLEYDVMKLVHGLKTTTKPIVGVISSLNMAQGFDPASRRMTPGWAFMTSLSELFEVRQLNAASTTTIAPEIKTLVLVHPKGMTDDLADAVDQFVLRGGKLLVFVDPNAEADQEAQDPNNPNGQTFADKSSDMPKLFKSWGVTYDPNKVLVDPIHALQVQTPQGVPVRHPVILGFASDSINQDDVVSSQLGALNFSTTGVFGLAEGAPLKLTALVQSSDKAALTTSERVRFMPDPESLMNGYSPSGERYVLAGRLEGKLKTAFPGKSGADRLTESKEPADIILIADTDMLTDRLWVQVQSMFGQQVMNAFANNGDLAINAVDNLTGSSALISVRGRATSARPFTRVADLRHSADERFRVKEQELNKELAETERKLNDLQSSKSKESAMILSPEQKAELESFQAKKVQIRKDLRQVRRQLDASIESLGTRLKFNDILTFPLLLTVGVFFFNRWRRQRAARAV